MDDIIERWGQKRDLFIRSFTDGTHSFIPGLPPNIAVTLPVQTVLNILIARYGENIESALSIEYSDPAVPFSKLPDSLQSPMKQMEDAEWLKTAKVVGINVRTLGSFWNILAYSLTLPAAQNAIHLLPIWEPGVVGSLYGMSSWHINPEFFSLDLQEAYPHLDTVEKQLRVVVSLLHVTGRMVGMDVIPHTDRFSEMVFAYPSYFEWLRRDGTLIVDQRANLHKEVQNLIIEFLTERGSATEGLSIPITDGGIFNPGCPEDLRHLILFGAPKDGPGRASRRLDLLKKLWIHGYETVPATMGPPYRGLIVDPSPNSIRMDGNDLSWRDFLIAEPEPMSRVFGPLTRYKLYERLQDNAEWKIDFSRPRREAWDYVSEQIGAVQKTYGFDFMRGDMSHVQMRPEGVPEQPDEAYDLLRAVKNWVQARNQVPYFGYFAETFLAPAGTMAYGDEVAHLEAIEAESTLGDLQSTAFGSTDFIKRLLYYRDLLETRKFAPNFSVFTADKDDPRFDHFYRIGNDLRYFFALFLTDMPSYIGLGYETRDPHFEPAPNEFYSKLFVFHEKEGPKARKGPYIWGTNGELFEQISQIRQAVDRIWSGISSDSVRMLLQPAPDGGRKVFAWTQKSDPSYLFLINCDVDNPAKHLTIPEIPGVNPGVPIKLLFSNQNRSGIQREILEFNGYHYPLWNIHPGEARIYSIGPRDKDES